MTHEAQGKRTLVLGAGRGQVGLISALQSLGATVVVGTQLRDDLPGISLADEVVECDLRDCEGVLSVAKDLNIEAVATSCMDTAMPALGVLVDALGLRGVSAAAARLCNDKIAMKRQLVLSSVPTAAFEVIETDVDLESVLERIGLPAVFKAPHLQGSDGVSIVHGIEEAQNAFLAIRERSAGQQVLVEQFLEGIEFGAQALVHEGEVLFVLPHGDVLAAPSLPVPIEHYAPMAVDQQIHEKVVQGAIDAVKALSLDNCAVNIDFMLQGGVPHVIELTGRAGANGLPEMTGRFLGLNYFELIAREALDLNVIEYWDSRMHGTAVVLARMVSRPDLVGGITAVEVRSNKAPWLHDRTIFAKAGQSREGFLSSNDCLAQVVVSGETVDECRARADQAESEICFIMESL